MPVSCACVELHNHIFHPCLAASTLLHSSSQHSALLPLPWETEAISLPIPCVCCCCCSVTQSCPTLCNPRDCSMPGSSVHHGISQARILEWIAISSSRGSSQPRDWIPSFRKQWKQWLTLFFWAPRLLQMVIAAMKLKRHLLLGRKVMTSLDSIL